MARYLVRKSHEDEDVAIEAKASLNFSRDLEEELQLSCGLVKDDAQKAGGPSGCRRYSTRSITDLTWKDKFFGCLGDQDVCFQRNNRRWPEFRKLFQKSSAMLLGLLSPGKRYARLLHEITCGRLNPDGSIVRREVFLKTRSESGTRFKS